MDIEGLVGKLVIGAVVLFRILRFLHKLGLKYEAETKGSSSESKQLPPQPSSSSSSSSSKARYSEFPDELREALERIRTEQAPETSSAPPKASTQQAAKGRRYEPSANTSARSNKTLDNDNGYSDSYPDSYPDSYKDSYEGWHKDRFGHQVDDDAYLSDEDAEALAAAAAQDKARTAAKRRLKKNKARANQNTRQPSSTRVFVPRSKAADTRSAKSDKSAYALNATSSLGSDSNTFMKAKSINPWVDAVKTQALFSQRKW